MQSPSDPEYFSHIVIFSIEKKLLLNIFCPDSVHFDNICNPCMEGQEIRALEVKVWMRTTVEISLKPGVQPTCKLKF